MTGWRDRGFVSNSDASDDEDDIGNVRSGTLIPGNGSKNDLDYQDIDLLLPEQPRYSDTSARNDGGLVRSKTTSGGKKVFDIVIERPPGSLQATHSNTLSELNLRAPGSDNADQDDFSSSPLTELSSIASTELSPTGVSSSQAHEKSPHSKAPQQENVLEATNSTNSRTNSEEQLIESRGAYYRSLRTRNPIQLHPYMLEGERYRQFLRARGVKPLRISRPQGQAAQPDDGSHQESNDDGDSQSWQGDNDTQDIMLSPPPTSSPTENPQPLAPSYLSSDAPSSRLEPVDGEDFPDVNSLLRGHPWNELRRGHKKQKTSHPNSRSEARGLRQNLPRVTPRTIADAAPLPSRESPTRFEIPPSPPTSKRTRKTISPLEAQANFRLPPASSPPQIPLHERMQTLEEGSPKPFDPLTSDHEQESSSSGSSSNAAPPTADMEPPQRLRSFQRRIRGVLPASWLRLDQQVNTFPKRNDRLPSPEQTISRRGVAQRRIPSEFRKSEPTPSSEVMFELSDSSNDDIIGGPRATPGNGREPSPNTPSLGDLHEDVDATMDDGSTRESTPSNSPSGSKAQFPIVFHPLKHRKVTSKSAKPSQPGLIKPRRQSKISEKLGHCRSSRRHDREYVTTSAPRLGVLDAPEAASPRPLEIPLFLRIAKRQAKSRRNKGRHSPTKKFLRLATLEDSNEVDNILRDWRLGNILPHVVETDKPTASAQIRQPLAERDGNDQDVDTRVVLGGETETDPSSDEENEQLKIRTPSRTALPVDRAHRRTKAILPNQRRRRRIPSLVNIGAGPSISSTLRNSSHVARPAQLESTRSRYRLQNRRAVFTQQLQNIDRLYEQRLLDAPSRAKVPLGRFLDDDQMVQAPKPRSLPSQEPEACQVLPRTVEKPGRRSRKQQPRRLDVNQPSYLQRPVQNVHLERSSSNATVSSSSVIKTLQGLGAFGTDYPVSFDVKQLPQGCCFHENTFVGSGDLSKALKFGKRRDLSSPTNQTVVCFHSETFRWSAWGEDVSGDLEKILKAAASSPQTNSNSSREMQMSPRQFSCSFNIHSILRSIVQYLNDNIWFRDPPDRSSFLRRFTNILNMILEQFDPATIRGNILSATSETNVEVLKYVLVLAYQCSQLAAELSQEISLQTELGQLTLTAASSLVGLLLPANTQRLKLFYDTNPRDAIHELGRRNDCQGVEAWVTAVHILSQPGSPSTSVWDIINTQLTPQDLSIMIDLSRFEHLWCELFLMLPLFQFDELGVVAGTRRLKISDENWAIPTSLLRRLGAIYNSNRTGQPATFNAYFRTVCTRCHYLIKEWGWSSCETIIEALFDFFASNGLAPLAFEESYKSSNFLQRLDCDPNLDIESGDRSFHIFLKIIGLGIRRLRGSIPDKQLRNVVFRLMPNHGRQYPKEESVRQEDLASLRNHHDLLCTLYWAAPPSFRPRVDNIRDLVYPETSHREACHISIRAWRNLVRFQLSCGEDVSTLKPFDDWHSGLINQILRQHSLAKHEAQDQVASMAGRGTLAFSWDQVSATIAQNQHQLEAILSDALDVLKEAVSLARTSSAAKTLLKSDVIITILSLFDASKHRINKVVYLGLNVIDEFIKIFSRKDETATVQNPDDDSQEFGDWGWLESEGMSLDRERTEAANYFHHTVHEGLLRLMSNAFGADHVADESTLSKMVDVWVRSALLSTKYSEKTWGHYLESYQPESWTSLRNTEQKRTYTPYFLSKVLELDHTSLLSHRTFFLTCWMSSIVERSSVLKFQHLFTASILKSDDQNPLLRNLPFARSIADGNVLLTADEFVDRRRSLISILLSNMRDNLEEVQMESPRRAQDLRREYADLLRSFQASMKSNYQEMQQGDTFGGSYVGFVQCIVELLQQYSVEICPIDKYFTDSSAFPLPATDPTYVVGKLKNYSLKLSGSGVHKQLVMFFQSTSERAAIDRVQTYLASQLFTSMASSFEGEDSTSPTLRYFLINAIFPVYIESAFSTECGWILVLPIIKSTSQMLGDLFQDFDISNPRSLESVSQILSTILETCRRATHPLTKGVHLFELPNVLKTLQALIQAVTSALPLFDYIFRSIPDAVAHLIPTISYFHAFSANTLHIVTKDRDATQISWNFFPEALSVPSTKCSRAIDEARKFCILELKNSLEKSWIRHENEYYLYRGNSRKQVPVERLDYSEEKLALVSCLQEFQRKSCLLNGITDLLENLDVADPIHENVNDETVLWTTIGSLGDQAF
ncbi:MAG: hypothetical protein M4579_001938 [Chaenotheca gracillima]|nr:MAG: hypothetical protein M4579_001938 [Chaenotheca gracillima]